MTNYEPVHIKTNPVHGASLLAHAKRPGNLIEGFLPSKGVVFVAAAPHTGKTFLALEMARAVINGGKFLRKYQATKGRVLFVEQDSADWDFKRQIEKIMGWNLDHLYDPITGIPFDGNSDSLAFCITQTKWLNEKGLTRDLAYWANAHEQEIEDRLVPIFDEEGEYLKDEEISLVRKGFQLIILDSLSAMHEQDENSNVVMHHIIENARLLSELTNSCVVILHHINKGNEESGTDYLSLTRLRGASAITAAADCIFALYKRHRFTPEINLLMLKNRAYPEMQDIEYYNNKVENEQEKVILSCHSQEHGTTSFRLGILSNYLQNSSDEWFEVAFLVGFLMNAENETNASRTNTYRNALYRILTQLESEGRIIRERGKVKWKRD